MTAVSLPAVVRSLWVGAALALAGLLYDLRRHAAHDHFETAGDQVEAHWLSWLGLAVVAVFVGIVLLSVQVRRREAGRVAESA